MTENAASGGNAQEKPQYLTKADVEAMLGEFGKSIDQKIGGAVAGTLKKLDIGKAVGDAIALHEKAKAEAASGGEGGGDGGAGDKNKTVDPELVKLRRQVEETNKKFELSEKRRLETEAAARRKSALADLTASLSGKVRPEVASTLVGAWAGEITFDDDGNALLPLGDGTSTSIAAAVEQRVKSKDFEWARPAPNSGGSGATGSRANSNGSQVNVATLASKPRKDWSPAEQEAYFAHRTKQNAENGG